MYKRQAKKEKIRAYHRQYSREYRARNLEKQREYDRIKAREYRAKKKAQAAAAPVSYTHLDVYKRQVLWSFVGIRLLMPNALESRLSVIPDISGFSASEQGLLSAKGFTAPVPYVGIVWCTGMAVMLLFEALSYVHLRSKVKTAVQLSSNVYRCV